jgi:hypothetical protein
MSYLSFSNMGPGRYNMHIVKMIISLYILA